MLRKVMLVLGLLLLPAVVGASPLGLALRVEKLWEQTTPVVASKGKLVSLEEEWRQDVLASITADWRLSDTDLYLVGRFGHRLDAEQNEGAIGVEYRMGVEGFLPKPVRAKAKSKRPCP